MRIKTAMTQFYEYCNKRLIYTSLKYGVFPKLKIMTIPNTIDYILENNCSVARYGDGEFDLLFGTADEGYQKRSDKLSEALTDVLKKPSENLLICVPGYINSVIDAKESVAEFWKWYLWLGNKKRKIIQLIDQTIGKDYFFGNTQVTRPFDNADPCYAALIFPKIRKIWDNTDLLIIEGEQTRMGVGNDLFSNSRSIKRILAPAVDAFASIDEIRETTKKHYNNELILLALGPTATILASEFSKLGMRSIDLGHLDIEYEWYLRGSDEKIAISGKWVNESKDGQHYTVCNDEQYNQQVIARIGC